MRKDSDRIQLEEMIDRSITDDPEIVYLDLLTGTVYDRDDESAEILYEIEDRNITTQNEFLVVCINNTFYIEAKGTERQEDSLFELN